MPATALMSISFEATSVEEVESIIAGITGLPAGAVVSTSVSQVLATGIVDESGNLVDSRPPEASPAELEAERLPEPEPEAEPESSS